MNDAACLDALPIARVSRACRLAAIPLACALAAPLGAVDSAGSRMFERLRHLEGRWQGTLEWSQGRTGSGPLDVEYRLTGHGSALIEDLIMGGTASMTTVYHLDGADLRMTHYCAAGNQPRLVAARIDEAAATAEFDFVDVTNAQEHPAHVEAFSLHLVDDDHLQLVFRFGGGPGISGVETIRLERVRSPAATG